MTEKLPRLLAWLVVAAPVLLVADLFLDWHRTSVDIAGVVTAEERAMGWSGLGIVVGILAIALFAIALWRAFVPEAQALALLVVVAVLLVVLTGIYAFAGGATVQIEALDVGAKETFWPAYVGFAISVVAVAAVLVELALAMPRTTHLARPGTA